MEDQGSNSNLDPSTPTIFFKPSSSEITEEPQPPPPFPIPIDSIPNFRQDSCEAAEIDINGELMTWIFPSPPTVTPSLPISEKVSMRNAKITKYLNQPSFELRYADNYTQSFSLFSPITPLGLKNILIQHESLRFVCFHAGVISDKVNFQFSVISLPSLKKITIKIPGEKINGSSIISGTNSAFPLAFKRLIQLLKEINYGQLESIRIDCELSTALRIPLASAFVPMHETENYHPLTDLIQKNYESLQTLVIGPTLEEMIIQLNPTLCPKVCEPQDYPKIESVEFFSDVPLLLSWSSILTPQKHLTKVYVTLNHDEVWKVVVNALTLSRNSLKDFGVSLVPIDEEGFLVDLKVLSSCTNLKEFSIKFHTQCNVIGWGFLPKSITTLNLMGGELTHSHTELMSFALQHLEEVNVFLSAPDILNENIEIGTSVAHQVDVSNDVVPIIVDIVHHPTFHFVKTAKPALKTFNVECDIGIDLDWEGLRSTCGFQKEFKLIERTIGDFSLERDFTYIEEGVQVGEMSQEKEEQTKGDSWFGSSCFGLWN